MYLYFFDHFFKAFSIKIYLNNVIKLLIKEYLIILDIVILLIK